MDTKEIKDLIQLISESNITEFSFEEGKDKLVIKKEKEIITKEIVTQHVATQSIEPAAPALAAAPLKQVEASNVQSTSNTGSVKEDSNDGHIVTAPLVGVFYSSPNPDSAPYVKVGDQVKKGQTLCILEAMKLLNEIEADVDGVVKEIFVENTNPVEYGARLFRIDPI